VETNEDPPPTEPDFRIVGYFPDYRLSEVDASIADKLTDIIYFSIEPNPDGSLDLSNMSMTAYQKLNAMRLQNPLLKIYIAIGGWGRSDHFAEMATNAQSRQVFVTELTDFCLEVNFSGADFDWEFPANATEKLAYTHLLVETASSFKDHGLKVSVALNPNQKLNSDAYQAIDRINIMSYDHGGRHATYDQAIKDVNAFFTQNVSAEKLCLGMPFYGREIDNFSNAISYNSIVTKYNPGPNIDEVDGIYYNGIATIGQKTDYAFNAGLQGVMIWEIGQDASGEESLLTAINSKLNSIQD